MRLSVFFFSSLILSIFTFFTTIIFARLSKEKIHRVWTLFNSSLFIWGLGATLLSSPLEIQETHLRTIQGIMDIGVTFIAIFWLHVTKLLSNTKISKILPVSYILGILFAVMIMQENLIVTDTFKIYHSTFRISPPGKLYFLWFGYWSMIAIYAHFHLFRFYLSERQEDKKRIKLLTVATILGFTCGSSNFLYFLDLPIFRPANLGIVIYLLLVTYAVFKHKIFGLEIVYRKGLLYSLLIAMLSAIYLICVVFAEWAFRGLFGYRSLVFTLVLTFILAMLFNPLKEKIQAIIDRVFLGKTPQEIARENELLKQELERSERLKATSTLALGLAHEIKNPLTTIKTFSEFLPEKFKEEDFVKKFSKLIPNEVERINKIVQQLLNFSKPSPPNFKETDIHLLIDDTLEFLNSEFLKKKIIVEREFQAPEAKINADQAQMRQAILNIILNAVEAMPEGGKITVATKMTKDNYVAVTIRDTGCGITKKNMKNIFNPFFTTKDTGTGLGLAICHQIIENHKGSIAAESKIGNGTTFIMTLPISNWNL